MELEQLTYILVDKARGQLEHTSSVAVKTCIRILGYIILLLIIKRIKISICADDKRMRRYTG